MAVVAEYKFDKCTAAIHDDAYAGISEEEMARRIRASQRVAWEIWERAKLRELAKLREQEGKKGEALANPG